MTTEQTEKLIQEFRDTINMLLITASEKGLSDECITDELIGAVAACAVAYGINTLSVTEYLDEALEQCEKDAKEHLQSLPNLFQQVVAEA